MVMQIPLSPLSKGLFAIVDDDDFERLSAFKWFPNKGRHGSFYAAARMKREKNGIWCRTTREMQRFLLDSDWSLPPSVKVDHINGDVLDNRRQNLRVVSDSVSNLNRRIFKTNSSGYRGVSYDKRKKKWYACIKVNKKSINLGRYATREEAAAVYNAKAIEVHGANARLNVIYNQETPDGN